jgi:2,4-dienoyl-CoA reductase-like NADH-dependent reductase (Old Yellow Enzyme family)
MSSRKNSVVYTPNRIGPLDLKNRLVRSATFEHAATVEGEVSDALIAMHRRLAKGGVGLIMTGIAWFYPNIKAPPRMVRADNDSFIPGLQRLAKAVHESAPDCKIMLQLHHPGRQVINPDDMPRIYAVLPPAQMAFLQKHPEAFADASGTPHVMESVAPSSIRDALFERIPRALILDEIEQIIDTYAEAICRAQEAGFDGAQFHAAHGWLLSSFLSPRTNQRTDQYGGSTENRTRIVTEIYRRARKKVGNHFPLLIKFNATDFLPGGTDLDEGIRVAKILAETGFDAVEVSGGMWETTTRPKDELGWPPVLLPESRTGIKTIDQEAYFLPFAKAVKESTANTVISVGGYRSFSKIESALASKSADFVSLSRPLIRQPDLPNLWHTGEGPDKAECISCNACLPVGALSLVCRAKLKG